MDIMRPVKYLLPLLFFALSACKKEQSISSEPISVGQASFTSLDEARMAVDTLYILGAPALYLDCDEAWGLPLAWGAYLSGLVESEATEGYYPELYEGRHIARLSQKLYDAYFAGIERSEIVLDQLAEVKTGISFVDRDRLRGEAKFFRALNRFALLRTFGVHPQKRGEVMPTSEKEFYGVIVRDLQEAIARLPQVSFVENKSRITAFVARALLAEVYIQMSGHPLDENHWAEAVAILRPIIKSGKHSLAQHGSGTDLSAYNSLRTNHSHPEYLYTIQGKVGQSTRAVFSFPKKAKAWSNVLVAVAFNAYQPSELLMSLYSEDDLRGQDRQLFHSFYKVREETKTIFEVFAPAPYFWLSEGNGAEAKAPSTPEVGVYRYAEVLLMLAEAVAQSEGITQEAVEALLAVRSRAQTELNAREEHARLLALSREDFLREVYLERLRELPLEMKQACDIRRTGLYPLLSHEASPVRGEASSSNSSKELSAEMQGKAIIFVPVDKAITPSGRKLPVQLLLPLPPTP